MGFVSEDREPVPDDVLRHLDGATVYGTGTEKLGTVERILTGAADEPEWILVKLGLLGGTTWLPLKYAQVGGDAVYVPYNKAQVKSAPSVKDDDQGPSEADRIAIYAHYEDGHQLQGERFRDNVAVEQPTVDQQAVEQARAEHDDVRRSVSESAVNEKGEPDD